MVLPVGVARDRRHLVGLDHQVGLERLYDAARLFRGPLIGVGNRNKCCHNTPPILGVCLPGRSAQDVEEKHGTPPSIAASRQAYVTPTGRFARWRSPPAHPIRTMAAREGCATMMRKGE